MKPPTTLGVLITFVFLAAAPPGPGAQDDEDFSVLYERNVFDPNRSPQRETAEAPGWRPPDPPREQMLYLVGAMTVGDAEIAFFDGDADGARGAVRPGDEVAGLRLVEAGADSVRLQGGETSFTLRIGQALRRTGDGPWQVAGFERPSRSGAEASNGSSDESEGGAGSEADEEETSGDAGGSANDILERLRARREQEMNR